MWTSKGFTEGYSCELAVAIQKAAYHGLGSIQNLKTGRVIEVPRAQQIGTETQRLAHATEITNKILAKIDQSFNNAWQSLIRHYQRQGMSAEKAISKVYDLNMKEGEEGILIEASKLR